MRSNGIQIALTINAVNISQLLVIIKYRTIESDLVSLWARGNILPFEICHN